MLDVFKEKKSSFVGIALIIAGLFDIGSCSIIVRHASENSTTKPYDFCTTQSCKTTVERMANKMDQTVDPCDDFYEFTCGTYLNSNVSNDNEQSHVTEWDLIYEVSKKIENQLISTLEKDIYNNDTEAMKIAKSLYKNCLNTSAFDKQDLTPFLDILEQVGGWPVLKENKTWNETAFNWDRLIFKIGDRDYWDNIFIPLKPYNVDESFKILLSEPTLGLDELDLLNGTENNNVKNYFKYMVDMAVGLGATEEYATKELKDALEFEMKLANITLGDEKIRRIESISNFDLKKDYSFIPWDEYMNNKLSFNIIPGDKILFFDLKYINNLKNLIESTSTRVIANYVIWRYVDDFAYYLNKTTRDIKMHYKNEISWTTSNNDKQKSQCLQFLAENMELILNFIYVHQHFNENTVVNVNTIFDNVHNKFVELAENASWIETETKKRIIEKFKNISPVMGYPEELLYDFVTDKFLVDLKFVDGNYMENLFNMRMYNKDFFLRCTNAVNNDDCRRLIICRNNALGADLYSSLNGNLLCVSARYFQDTIMYNDDFPMYMKYGRTGNTLGHEISHVLDINEYKMSNWRDYNRGINWPEDYYSIYSSQAECIMSQSYKFTQSGLENSRTMTVEDIADNAGIRAAYYAYEQFSKMDKNQKMIDKVYTPRQMFWISAASIWCKHPNDAIRTDPWHRLYNHLPKSQIIGSFSNMEEFANDFNCPKNSPMNPSNKCRFW